MWLNMKALLYDRLKHPKRCQPRPVNIRLDNVFFESLLITDVERVLASADLVEGDAEGPDVALFVKLHICSVLYHHFRTHEHYSPGHLVHHLCGMELTGCAKVNQFYILPLHTDILWLYVAVTNILRVAVI